ncbi:MAG: trypsin-like serine protease [Alphaproteobacteria bacterium]
MRTWPLHAALGLALALAVPPAPVAAGDCRRTADGTCLSAPAAGGDALFGVLGADDRTPVDPVDWPWRAIGRLDFASGSYCTGSLVGPRLVLTAAHCLFAGPDSDALDPIVEFAIGAPGGSVIHVRATEALLPPRYDNIRHGLIADDDGYDYAFIVLEQAVGAFFGTLPVAALAERDLATDAPILTEAGFSIDRPDAVTAHRGCRVLESFADGVILTDCDITVGDSGAPLLASVDGVLSVVGVISATMVDAAGWPTTTLAVDSRAFVAAWREATAGHP